ncbi:hypothetical protein G15_1304 [Enterococcus avium]|nr:hypothetical protein G15_1304 [Enterococcus avium]
MKKIVLTLFVLSFVLVGCGDTDDGYDPFGSTAEERAKSEEIALSKENADTSESSTDEESSNSSDYTEPNTVSESTASSSSISSSIESSSIPETSSASETADSQEEILKPTSDQKDLIIAFTQQDCDDRGYKLTYQGKDSWNVSLNYIDGVNKWIVTNKDKKYGRVKSIYEWNGKEDSGAKLTYLLVNGEELINNL